MANGARSSGIQEREGAVVQPEAKERFDPRRVGFGREGARRAEARVVIVEQRECTRGVVPFAQPAKGRAHERCLFRNRRCGGRRGRGGRDVVGIRRLDLVAGDLRRAGVTWMTSVTDGASGKGGADASNGAWAWRVAVETSRPGHAPPSARSRVERGSQWPSSVADMTTPPPARNSASATPKRNTSRRGGAGRSCGSGPRRSRRARSRRGAGSRPRAATRVRPRLGVVGGLRRARRSVQRCNFISVLRRRGSFRPETARAPGADSPTRSRA